MLKVILLISVAIFWTGECRSPPSIYPTIDFPTFILRATGKLMKLSEYFQELNSKELSENDVNEVVNLMETSKNEFQEKSRINYLKLLHALDENYRISIKQSMHSGLENMVTIMVEFKSKGRESFESFKLYQEYYVEVLEKMLHEAQQLSEIAAQEAGKTHVDIGEPILFIIHDIGKVCTTIAKIDS